MPPLPNVPQVLKVSLQMQDGGGTFGNRLFLQYMGGPPDHPSLQTFATLVGTAWNSHMAASTTSALTLSQITVEDLTSTSSAVGVDTTLRPGTYSGAINPNNVSLDIEFKIQQRYRGGKGVWHHSGAPQSWIENVRQWLPADAAQMATNFAGWVNVITTTAGPPLGTMNHVVVRGYRNPPPAYFPDIQPVIAYNGRVQVGSMRKRTRALR